jgi:hypothetical protein
MSITCDICSREQLNTYKGTEEDVDNGDKGLRNEQTLPEVHRASHLGQEGDEHHSSRVGI